MHSDHPASHGGSRDKLDDMGVVIKIRKVRSEVHIELGDGYGSYVRIWLTCY